MLFGEDYDRSLWLMLASDKDIKERIKEFIKSIPVELYSRIHEQLALVQSYDENGVSFDLRDEELFQNNQMNRITENDLVYHFSLDPYTYDLTLGCFSFETENKKDIFELTLYPFDKDYFMLGTIQFMSSDGVHTINYQTTSTLFGIKVNRTYDYTNTKSKSGTRSR